MSLQQNILEGIKQFVEHSNEYNLFCTFTIITHNTIFLFIIFF